MTEPSQFPVYTAALVTLGSPNFAALVNFYRQLLHQEPHSFSADRYAEFQLPGLRLGIFRPKAATPSSTPVPPPTGSNAIGMAICLEVDNLDQAIAHLTALGYPPPGAPLAASHGREVYAYDPDGNWLILHQAVKPDAAVS